MIERTAGNYGVVARINASGAHYRQPRRLIVGINTQRRSDKAMRHFVQQGDGDFALAGIEDQRRVEADNPLTAPPERQLAAIVVQTDPAVRHVGEVRNGAAQLVEPDLQRRDSRTVARRAAITRRRWASVIR